MQIITLNGFFTVDKILVDRLEPWTTPQDWPDERLGELPTRTIIVVPPEGYRFKEGVDVDKHPTAQDIELIPTGEAVELIPTGEAVDPVGTVSPKEASTKAQEIIAATKKRLKG